MKTRLLLSIILLTFTLQFTHAQCTENVSNFGNNTSIPSYNISGDVNLVLNLDNTVTLDLGSNFSTASGPDIRAYLVKSNGISDTTLKNTLISNLDHIEFGLVGSLPGFGNPVVSVNGAKSFTISIPDEDNIEDYDKIFFYCLLFDQFWDLGTFTSFSENTCSVLNIDDNVLSDLSIYPNPTSENITIKGLNNRNVNLEIYDMLGKSVLSKKINTTELINVSEFRKGIYLLKIDSAGKTKTQKLIIN